MAETGKTPINHNTETNLPEAECLAGADLICDQQYSETPEKGIGALPPLCRVESLFNDLTRKLPAVSAILLLLIAVFITIDVVGRLGFDKPWIGITELELLKFEAGPVGGMGMGNRATPLAAGVVSDQQTAQWAFAASSLR